MVLKDNHLLLLSGNDIPFIEAQISIHQPTIKEIAYIGEMALWSSCDLLNFSKNSLDKQGKVVLRNKTDFDIILTMLMDKKSLTSIQKKVNLILLFTIIFPDYTVEITKTEIILTKDDDKVKHSINNNNFLSFKEKLAAIFRLDMMGEGANFNPADALAQKIADKISQGNKKRQEVKSNGENTTILDRYISILSVGEQKNMNELFGYTVYQLFDEFQRFRFKLEYDMYMSAKLAGAKGMKEAEDWMQDIYADKKVEESKNANITRA